MIRVYIDVETTGFTPYQGDRIIEIGAVSFDDDWNPQESFSSMVNPGDDHVESLGSNNPALAVNGIEIDEIRDAPSEASVAHIFNRYYLARLRNRDEISIHSYHVEFDQRFLRLPPWNIDDSSWGECIMIAAQKMMRQKKFPKLVDAAVYCEVGETQTHRAYADADMAAGVHKYILEWRRN